MTPVPTTDSRFRLLLVDDETPVRASMRRELRAIPTLVIEDFESSIDALARHRAAPFGAAVLDLRMPGMDGVALARALREVTPDLPLLFVTGNVDGELLQAAAAMGMVLEKPWDHDVLIAAIRSLVSPT